MDRRRFVPSPEGLEVRELMASFLSPSTTPSPSVQNLPDTYKQKITRIERLPFFLRSFEKGRILPDAAIAPLQTDLITIQGHLHTASSPVLDQFNKVIRDVIPHQSLSEESARKLNQAFGVALATTGASPSIVASLQADMNTLAKIDSHDSNPTILATNDYSTVLQTAIGVGLPIRTPAAPVLAKADSVGSATSHTTNKTQPHLVGTYEPGATINILNENGVVVGSTTVTSTGKYSVQFSSPLSLGRHVIRVQAIDHTDTSPVSVRYAFKVVAPPKPHVVVGAAHP
jgi:hypothetical protein